MFHGRNNKDVDDYVDRVYEVAEVDGWWEVVLKGGWVFCGGDDCGRFPDERTMLKELSSAHRC